MYNSATVPTLFAPKTLFAPLFWNLCVYRSRSNNGAQQNTLFLDCSNKHWLVCKIKKKRQGVVDAHII